MEHSFYATLEATVLIPDEEFNFIFQCFERNYDHNIKLSCKIGGWMFGFKNRRTKFYPEEIITDEERTVELSNRKIQLIIKSLEMQSEEIASKINLSMHKILGELVEKQNEINKQFLK